MRKHFLSVIALLSVIVLLFSSCDETMKPQNDGATSKETTEESTPVSTDEETTEESTDGMTTEETSEETTPVSTDEEIPEEIQFVFRSNGDGTCVLEKIEFPANYTNDVTLEIPEKSPEGDRVVAYAVNAIPRIPNWVLVSDFTDDFVQPMEALIKKATGDERSRLEYLNRVIPSYYGKKDTGDLDYSEIEREQFKEYYPITELAAIYVLDTKLSGGEIQKAREAFKKVGFTYADLLREHDNMVDLIEKSDSENKAKMLDTLPLTHQSVYPEGIVGITLPQGITKIGDCAFLDCSALQTINLPDGLISIGAQTFMACDALTEIVVPESVTEIGQNCFKACINLKTVSLPAGLTSIGNYLFLDCSSLETVNFGGTKAQWRALTDGVPLEESLDPYMKRYHFIVTCSDGTIQY